MFSLKKYFMRPLTGRETAAVVMIVVLMAGLGYFGYLFVTAKMLEARVNAALPKICNNIREQRRGLLSSIEAYKRHFGVYPPDNVISRHPLTVDAIDNPLLYELAGVTYNQTNQMFQLGNLEAADAKFVKEFFHFDGFKNCAGQADMLKRFLVADPLPARQLHDDPDVFAVASTGSFDGVGAEVAWEIDVSSWRYVSSSATNNPGKFDLWIEVETKGKKIVVGNWQAAE